MTLGRVPCIHYPVKIRKVKKESIRPLIDSGSEVNLMTPAYAKQLGLPYPDAGRWCMEIRGASEKTRSQKLGYRWEFWRIALRTILCLCFTFKHGQI